LHQFTFAKHFSAIDNFAIPSTLKIFARISLLTVQTLQEEQLTNRKKNSYCSPFSFPYWLCQQRCNKGPVISRQAALA